LSTGTRALPSFPTRRSSDLAGFYLRYASKKSRVLVAVSGDGWRIEPQNGTIKTGEFKHSSSGLFRAEIKDKTVRVLWNGGLVTRSEEHTSELQSRSDLVCRL